MVGIAGKALFVAAVLSLLAACVPETEIPLTAKPQPTNNMLVGHWQSKVGDALHVLQISSNAHGHAKATLAIMRHERTDWRTFEFDNVSIGLANYVQLRLTDRDIDDGQNPRWVIARYEFARDGSLTFRFMTDEQVSKDIATGSIDGRKGRGSEAAHVLTASAETLRAYIAKSDPNRLFGVRFGPFRRIPEAPY